VDPQLGGRDGIAQKEWSDVCCGLWSVGGRAVLGRVASCWAVFCAAKRIERVCSVVEL
jgi:hypothetical protein